MDVGVEALIAGGVDAAVDRVHPLRCFALRRRDRCRTRPRGRTGSTRRPPPWLRRASPSRGPPSPRRRGARRPARGRSVAARRAPLGCFRPGAPRWQLRPRGAVKAPGAGSMVRTRLQRSMRACHVDVSASPNAITSRRNFFSPSHRRATPNVDARTLSVRSTGSRTMTGNATPRGASPRAAGAEELVLGRAEADAAQVATGASPNTPSATPQSSAPPRLPRTAVSASALGEPKPLGCHKAGRPAPPPRDRRDHVRSSSFSALSRGAAFSGSCGANRSPFRRARSQNEVPAALWMWSPARRSAR